MNAVDATDREAQTDIGVSASLLTIILDTNPHAWALLGDELPLSKVIANLLVFINAHLAINNANRIAVVASHVQRAQWLYPSPQLPTGSMTSNGVATNANESMLVEGGPVTSQPPEDPNKYRPFAHIERTLTSNLRALMNSTDPSDLEGTPSTMVAGALTMALTYISKATLSAGPRMSSSSGPTYDAAAGTFSNQDASGRSSGGGAAAQGLTSRILIVSVSGDLSHQYIPMMNAIFACQRLHCPIDILKLAGDTVFLQQAADATGGIYMSLLTPAASEDTGAGQQNGDTTARRPTRPAAKTAGILQYLFLAYLPDPGARAFLNTPGQSHGVDFRAACFCHRRVVDIGYVCSVCLSIFCEPGVLMGGGEDGGAACLTCGTALRVTGFGATPVVVASAATGKRKKRKGGGDRPLGREGTPGSGVATPG